MIALSSQPLDRDAVCKAVRAARFGSVVLFEGIVRSAGARGQTVRELYYEAYDEVALPEIQRIAAEVRARWTPCEVAIVHRVGALAVGEISVAVAVGSPHRAAAFEACTYAIEQVKMRAAIWKQERYTDGSACWLDGMAVTGV